MKPAQGIIESRKKNLLKNKAKPNTAYTNSKSAENSTKEDKNGTPQFNFLFRIGVAWITHKYKLGTK